MPCRRPIFRARGATHGTHLILRHMTNTACRQWPRAEPISGNRTCGMTTFTSCLIAQEGDMPALLLLPSSSLPPPHLTRWAGHVARVTPLCTFGRVPAASCCTAYTAATPAYFAAFPSPPAYTMLQHTACTNILLPRLLPHTPPAWQCAIICDTRLQYATHTAHSTLLRQQHTHATTPCLHHALFRNF